MDPPETMRFLVDNYGFDSPADWRTHRFVERTLDDQHLRRLQVVADKQTLEKTLAAMASSSMAPPAMSKVMGGVVDFCPPVTSTAAVG